MMKYFILLMLLVNLNSCQSQKMTAYEERVYDLLNSIYNSKKGNHLGNKIVYIDNVNNLHKSVDVISDDLLKTLLRKGKNNNRVHIPDSVMILQNWKDLQMKTNTDKFSQKRIVIPNIRFVDSNSNKNNFNIIHIEGILFYGNFVIVITNHGGTIQLATLFNKIEKNYNYVVMTGYPPLGDE